MDNLVISTPDYKSLFGTGSEYNFTDLKTMEQVEEFHNLVKDYEVIVIYNLFDYAVDIKKVIDKETESENDAKLEALELFLINTPSALGEGKDLSQKTIVIPTLLSILNTAEAYNKQSNLNITREFINLTLNDMRTTLNPLTKTMFESIIHMSIDTFDILYII